MSENNIRDENFIWTISGYYWARRKDNGEWLVVRVTDNTYNFSKRPNLPPVIRNICFTIGSDEFCNPDDFESWIGIDMPEGQKEIVDGQL